MLEQIEEVVKNYDADGIFLDIVRPKACYCQNCVRAILTEGNDPYDEVTAKEYGERLYETYTSKVRASIDKYKPGLPVFHNGGHIAKGRSDLAHMNTHLELESLPTGGWGGYDHFPMSAKYVINDGMDFLGMTGKFHTTWGGEFGGFKHPNALIYETSMSIAMGGAKCSIGDQLHPLGKMDPVTYEVIGKAYSQVEAKEAWCTDVENIADVAILSAESIDLDNHDGHESYYGMDVGANRMLLQTHHLYDIVDDTMDFTKYKVLILADSIRLDEKLLKKVNNYINSGGKVLASGASGLAKDSDEFVLDLGVNYVSQNKITPNYIKTDNSSRHESSTSMVMYSPSIITELTDGVELGQMENSYFNRETFTFCSHQHAPSTEEGIAPPGLVATDKTVYIPWNVFSEYAEVASLHLRDIVSDAIDKLLAEDKTLETDIPTQGIVTYMKQESENRHVLHLLYGSPVLRGGNSKMTKKPIEVIEDLVPLYETSVSLKVKGPVNKVYLAPQMDTIEWTQEEDIITFTVDKFTCHQMVVVE